MKKIMGVVVCMVALMCLCLTACAAQPAISEGAESVTITGITESDLAIAAVYDENMVLTGVKIYRDKSDMRVDYADIFNEYQNADYMKIFVWSVNQEPRMTAYPIELSKHRSSGEAEAEMFISVQGGGHTIIYRLNDTPAANSLYDRLPLTVDVENYGSNEKIFYPDTKLDTTDAIEGAGGAGGLAYFSPWGNVVMYYDSFGQYPGLYILGEAVLGTEYISDLTGTITVERANTVMTEYEYTTQTFYSDNNGKNIYGELYIPQGGKTKKPAVIFSHGFGGNHTDGSSYADAFAKMGYVVYCFDFCGGGYGSRSDGKMTEMSIFTEQRDLESVIDNIRSLDYVDSDNIFLLGGSQGGAVSAITAADNIEKVKGLMLLYPAFVIPDDARSRFKRVDEIPDTYSIMGITVGKVYAENLLDYDIYEDIKAFDKDVLIIHGDNDSIVPVSYSEKAKKIYKSADLKVISGAGHGFYGENNAKAIDYLKEYLNKH